MAEPSDIAEVDFTKAPPPINAFQNATLRRADVTGKLSQSCQEWRYIPAPVFEHEKITRLDLSTNYIRSLPAALARLPNLVELNLLTNNFEHIPHQLLVVKDKLETLILRNNKLKAVSGVINEMAALKSLDLERNEISEVFPLAHSPSLTHLNLRRNRLEHVPPQLGPALKELLVDLNALREFPSAAFLRNLESLSASGNQIHTLPANLGLLASLTTLNISNNQIKLLPDSVTQLVNLQELRISHNNLRALPAGVSSFKHLRTLMAANNELSSIPDGLWECASLTSLNLCSNYLSAVSPAIGNLSQLTELNLASNQVQSFPEEIYCLPNLVFLALAYNRMAQLPACVSSLQRLDTLMMNSNSIEALPDEFYRLTNLRQLFLANNLLTALSPAMGDMKGLATIDLRCNCLKQVPVEALQLPLLERIDLSHNPDLSGVEVPDSVPQPDKIPLEVDLTATAQAPFSKKGRYVCSVATMKGRRGRMENCHSIQQCFNGRDHEDYFAVFDGHGGVATADFCAKHMHALLAQGIKRADESCDIPLIMKDCFRLMNEKLKPANIQSSGSTAVIAYFTEDKCFLANVGDTRAVMFKSGKPLRVSKDHKPTHAGEEARIRSLGGYVNKDGRVNGIIAVARALGDFDIQPFVTFEPDVQVYETLARGEALIMACDGVWDVISDELVCKLVNAEPDPVKAAMRIRDHAYLFGSMDNVSVIVVRHPLEG